jgi:hypothetical protein
MQAEFEEECRRLKERITEIEKELKARGAGYNNPGVPPPSMQQ